MLHSVTSWERLAELVKARRLEMGLTQQEAADRAGLGSATWNLIETAGRHSYKDRTYARLESALAWPSGTVQKVLESPKFTPRPVVAPTRHEVLERLDQMESSIREEVQEIRREMERLLGRGSNALPPRTKE